LNLFTQLIQNSESVSKVFLFSHSAKAFPITTGVLYKLRKDGGYFPSERKSGGGQVGEALLNLYPTSLLDGVWGGGGGGVGHRFEGTPL
jgi:hypothetical protein